MQKHTYRETERERERQRERERGGEGCPLMIHPFISVGYSGVHHCGPEERAAYAAFPFDEAAEMASLGANEPFGEEGFTTLERRWVARSERDCLSRTPRQIGKGRTLARV